MIDVRKFKLVSDQVDYPEVEVIVREAERILQQKMAGGFVELGCFVGTTALFLQRLLLSHGATNELHVYDSFTGLPEKQSQDISPAGEQFKGGELHATKNQLIKHFRQANLPLPIIHKGWFEELSHEDFPKTISFAFLDGDFYSSIKSSLDLITPHLETGATIIIDDYMNEALPGAKKAADDWAANRRQFIAPEKSLGVIHYTI